MVYGNISGRKFKRTNIVAAKCGKCIVAPMIYDGTTDAVLFEHWFEHALLKEIPSGSYCILDNAAFHRKSRLHDLAQKAGCTVIFLPPYSPDLNLIEKYWAWLKGRLRKTLPESDDFISTLCRIF
jgi:transposase